MESVEIKANDAENVNGYGEFSIDIPILTNSYFDLTNFDFSSYDIFIYNIDSKEFVEYLERAGLKSEMFHPGFYEEITKDVRSEKDMKYAIVKANPFENFKYSVLENVETILLIICPSLLQIEHVVHYHKSETIISTSYTTYNRKISYEDSNRYFHVSEGHIEEINKFIREYFTNVALGNYIGLAINNYLNSFNASHLHFRYISLCIAIENIVSGSEEITYKLRRTLSILCGRSEFHSETIYENVKKIYSLRSKILHGEYYPYIGLKDYYFPLQALVSIALIELLMHNFETNEKLTERITRLGFGDRDKISTNWKEHTLNSSTLVETHFALNKIKFK